jgi:hypothetical protein
MLLVPAFPQFADYDHHTLQVVPFFGFGLGRLTESLLKTPLRQKQLLKGAVAISIGALATVAAVPITWTARFIDDRSSNKVYEQKSKYSSESMISKFISELEVPNQTALALQDHFIFWTTGLNPVVREAIHPSMFTNPQVLGALYGVNFNEVSAVRQALDRRPGLVLRVPGPLAESSDSLLKERLRSDYEFIEVIDGVEIWRLK